MNKLLIKYRTWHQAIPPKQIKLQIPGWAGESNDHKDGDKPQPWHCPPFVEGSTYGLELCYPFKTECHIYLNDEKKVIFEGDFTEEQKECPNVTLPPFACFAPGHFGMTSALDIQVPIEYVLRTEPHPKFYTDETNTTPCCLPGHIQTEWWPKIFFVVFKNPIPGQTIIFREKEPYGQILIVPKKVNYEIQKMNTEEELERSRVDDLLNRNNHKFIKNAWKDNKGQNFDDKYKVLSGIAAKSGADGVKEFLNESDKKIIKTKTFLTKLIKRKS